MSISERTLKIVWSEAGGRCAICQVQVLTPSTDTDDPSVFGELAHIAARRPGGPRAGDLSEAELDSHENLVLLCNRHHKQVDDQPEHFTVEKLHQIKRDHARWIRSHGEARPVRLVPDPAHSQPTHLTIITTGGQLWSMITDCVATSYAYPDRLPPEDGDLIVEFLDLIRDYADIGSEITGVREQRDVHKALGRYISELAERRYLVGAYLKRMLLTGGVGDPTPWNELRVEVQPADQTEVVDKSGRPLGVRASVMGRQLARQVFLRWLNDYKPEAPENPASVEAFFANGPSREGQDRFWRDLIRGLRDDGLILIFESMDFWSSSALLTDKGRAELEDPS